MADSLEGAKDEKKPLVVKTAADLQRIKLMKLMKNPEKPAFIPERPKEKNIPTAPELVRNVMGSGAGAGSGDFHLYRNLRRKENTRLKAIEEKGQKELLDEEFQKKRENAKRMAEEATAKKRAKRLKKKEKMKQKKLLKSVSKKEDVKKENDSESSSDSDDEDNVN